jgi:transposase
MNDHNELTDRQVRVIPYLLGAPSIEQACKRARVSKATVYGWLKEKTFKQELKRQRDAVIERALDSLKANLSKATETLIKHLDSQKEAVSLKAAERIIKLVEQAMEVEQVSEQRAEDNDDWLTEDQKKQIAIAEKRRLARMTPAPWEK